MKSWQKWALVLIVLAFGVFALLRPRYQLTISPVDGQQWLVETTSGHTWMFSGGMWIEVRR